MCSYCGKPHGGVCRKKIGACLTCGSLDHFIKDCPKRSAIPPPPPFLAPAAMGGRGSGSTFGRGAGGRGGFGRGQKAANSGVRPETRVAARTYAVRGREEAGPSDVVAGTFLLQGLSVLALIDPGSTHSYVCLSVAKRLDLPVEFTPYRLEVSNPLGHSVTLNQIFKSCPIVVQGRLFPADLMELPFEEFDLILGMDWLTTYGVVVDCKLKSLTL